MWFGVVTLFPEVFDSLSDSGVLGRAIRQGGVRVDCFNPRDFSRDRHRTVDDSPYGGGAGMVMMLEPLGAAVTAAVERSLEVLGAPSPVVFLTPAGTRFDQATANQRAQTAGLILVCGRYEGVDQRFVDQHVDECWSIGDYVLSGGELAAQVVIDSMARQLPGTLGNARSKFDESHLDGRLDYPQYTRPEIGGNDALKVPEVLLSGDHRRVTEYRRREALKVTYNHRPDLLTGRVISPQELLDLRQALGEMTEDEQPA